MVLRIGSQICRGEQEVSRTYLSYPVQEPKVGTEVPQSYLAEINAYTMFSGP